MTRLRLAQAPDGPPAAMSYGWLERLHALAVSDVPSTMTLMTLTGGSTCPPGRRAQAERLVNVGLLWHERDGHHVRWGLTDAGRQYVEAHPLPAGYRGTGADRATPVGWPLPHQHEIRTWHRMAMSLIGNQYTDQGHQLAAWDSDTARLARYLDRLDFDDLAAAADVWSERAVTVGQLAALYVPGFWQLPGTWRDPIAAKVVRHVKRLFSAGLVDVTVTGADDGDHMVTLARPAALHPLSAMAAGYFWAGVADSGPPRWLAGLARDHLAACRAALVLPRPQLAAGRLS